MSGGVEATSTDQGVVRSDADAQWVPSVEMPAGLVATFTFIASEIALFAVPWLSVMYVTIIRERQGSWTGSFAHALEPASPLIGTVFLLIGSVTMQMAVHARKSGRDNVVHPRLTPRVLVAITAIFGAGFIALQAHEFVRLHGAGLGPTSSIFAATFFALVGLHGVHVTGGVLSQLAQLPGLRARHADSDTGAADESDGPADAGVDAVQGPASRSTMLEATTWYWHFVDVMWLAILGIIYVPQFFK